MSVQGDRAPERDPLAAVAALPGVPAAVSATASAVDRVAGHGAMRLRAGAVSAEVALRSARASAALSGTDVPLATLRTGAALEDPALAAVSRGAVRVTAAVGELRTVWATAPRQALARLHAVAAADGPLAGTDLGRPATPEAAARLDLLAGLLTAGTDAPGVVLAAIVHGEIAAVEAFGWGSGLVARAAGRCVLLQRGADLRGAVAPEVGHVRLGLTVYQEALVGYRTGTPDGVAGWVVHCARALQFGAVDALRVCASLR